MAERRRAGVRQPGAEGRDQAPPRGPRGTAANAGPTGITGGQAASRRHPGAAPHPAAPRSASPRPVARSGPRRGRV